MIRAIMLLCVLDVFSSLSRAADEKKPMTREALKQDFMAQAQKIAEKSKNAHAKEVVAYLKGHIVLCEPVKEGVQFLENAKDDQWVSFVPLMKGDEKLSDLWRKHATLQASGAFFPEQRSIILRSNEEWSETWKGMMLLREGHHAFTYMSKPYDVKDAKMFFSKERDAYTFLARLMTDVGGKQYTDVLAKEVKRIKDQIKQDKGEIGVDFPTRTDYDSTLDMIFGPALSDLEKGSRQTVLWIVATFELLNLKFKGNVEDRKALFLFHVLKQN